MSLNYESHHCVWHGSTAKVFPNKNLTVCFACVFDTKGSTVKLWLR